MKKIIPLLAASSLLLCSDSFASVEAKEVTQSPTSAPQATSVKYMFVIRSPEGSLSQVNGNHYKLVVPAKDISSVLAFSDRPERIVKRLTLDEYVKLVHTGNDSFSQTPPSVALTLGDNPTTVFELVNAEKVGDSIAYKLLLLSNQTPPREESGAVSLYVDSISFSGGGTFNVP